MMMCKMNDICFHSMKKRVHVVLKKESHLSTGQSTVNAIDWKIMPDYALSLLRFNVCNVLQSLCYNL